MKEVKSKNDIIFGGKIYKPNKEGIVAVPDDYKPVKGVEPVEASSDSGEQEVDLEDLDKNGLIELAVQMNIGPKSTLERWGEERLKQSIEEASGE